jgi:hypothetical protein
MIVGVILIFQHYATIATNLIAVQITNLSLRMILGIIGWGNIIFYILAIFVLLFWGIERHRPMLEISAICTIFNISAISSMLYQLIYGNTIMTTVFLITTSIMPIVFIFFDAVQKRQSRIFTVLLVLSIALNLTNRIPRLSEAWVVSRGALDLLDLIGDFKALTLFPLIGLYFLFITPRGTQWFDKNRVVVIFLGFGVSGMICIIINIIILASIYGGIYSMPYSILPLVIDAILIFTGIKAWILGKKALTENVLFHIL